MQRSRHLERGDSAPWFEAAALDGARDYKFDTIAGRHVLMLFFESAADRSIERALQFVQSERALFDDRQACFFGITCDREDAEQRRIAKQLPGVRFFLDYDRRIGDLFGLLDGGRLEPRWLLLDPLLRLIDSFSIDQAQEAIRVLRSELGSRPVNSWAPVLAVPNVFPDDLCHRLVAGYEQDGGHPSGFVRQVDGKTVQVVDGSYKQRRDWVIPDEALRSEIVTHIARHLTVPIDRAFQFRATRIERYLVACYEAGAGFFRPHRDNTTSGTAHRKFAVTINLNAGQYDGGDLRFPEFGERVYCAPTGGALVFSCSLLHEATPVTSGRRFAFLPFLYDEESARLRESKNAQLGENVQRYKKD